MSDRPLEDRLPFSGPLCAALIHAAALAADAPPELLLSAPLPLGVRDVALRPQVAGDDLLVWSGGLHVGLIRVPGLGARREAERLAALAAQRAREAREPFPRWMRLLSPLR